MITVNIDVGDGLVNGACGVLKYVQMKFGQPETVFIDFQSENVGRKAKSSHLNKLKNINEPLNEAINAEWVPVKMFTAEISTFQLRH